MTRIVILGAGPTGLGAAYRLQELGHADWDIYERSDHVGGLASSFTDAKGFTYDIGGHVLFSHYKYFDDLVDRLLGENFTKIQREAWIWMKDRYLPYPFQNNVRHLPKEDVLACLTGLIEAQRMRPDSATFEEWINATFGEGIARLFMLPYNFKVWATPAHLMSKQWMAERVSVVDVARVLRNVINEQDDASWGPNNTFKYPLRGGTGAIYRAFVPHVEPRLHLGMDARAVDLVRKRVTFADGSSTGYDVLISTMPLDQLVTWSTEVPTEIAEAATQLIHNSSYIVGVGVNRPCPTSKCWIYFPEETSPFYRVTYLSNYSPNMAPEGHFLLLSETTHSPWKPEPKENIVERVIDGMIATHLLEEEDRSRIVATHRIDVPYEYPVPTLGRDDALAAIQPFLMDHDVYSRGRFGAWLYEIGNMDHSVMQGVETVNHVLLGQKEETWKPASPSRAPKPVAA
ncbi:MAG TPA: FAD-dependent oxidoreductase [Candidatus Polarisedimenticolia bacterium]|nr:FAD-dependent oxidoreductase [Candidatus Polarisedimenticolia bacterium]